MRKGKYILLLLLPLFLTGCWDQKDPEDRTFILALGIDRAEEGCRFTFAPANMDTGEAETYQAESRTLAAAVAEVDTKISRQTELGQLKTIIFSKDILENREQTAALLQELERSQAVSEKVMLLSTEGSAAKCVEAVMKEDGKTGLFLWDFYKNTAEEVAVTKGMDLDTFLTEQAERDGNSVIPRISVKDEKVKVGGAVALSKDGVFLLSDGEERGYLFLLGEAEGAILEAAYGRETIPLEIVRSDVKYDFSLQDAHILCRITLPLEGTIQGGEGTLFSSEKRKELEGIFSESIKREVAHTIKTAERAGADFFGILPRMEQQEPSLTEQASKEALWHSLVFEIQPELKLKDMGRKR